MTDTTQVLLLITLTVVFFPFIVGLVVAAATAAYAFLVLPWLMLIEWCEVYLKDR